MHPSPSPSSQRPAGAASSEPGDGAGGPRARPASASSSPDDRAFEPPAAGTLVAGAAGVVAVALAVWVGATAGWPGYALVAAIAVAAAAAGAAVVGQRRRYRKLEGRLDLMERSFAPPAGEAPPSDVIRSVLANAPAAIILCDADGQVAYANAHASELLNGGEALDGARFQDVLDRHPPELREALGSPRFVVVDGQPEPESYHVTTRKLASDGQVFTLHMLRRVTDEVNRQEVEVWKRLIREFQHQLANSLTPIATKVHAARVMLDKPGSADKVAAILAAVAEHTDGLKQFLDRYARLARLPRPNRARVAWSSLFDRMHHLAPFHLRGDLPEQPGWFDPGQIEQVLINLIKNAHESGSPREDVEVTVTPTERGVAIRVLDRGPGMTEEALGLAHQPFYSTKRQGSGIGLALSRDILVGHGGQMQLRNRDGGGLVVTCWLPGEQHPDAGSSM